MSRRRNAIPNINSNHANHLIQPSADIGNDEALVTKYEESLQSMCSSSRNPRAQFPIGLEIKGRQGEALIRDIIRRSEIIVHYDNMALTLQNDWEPSSWTYTFRSQVHSGGRKGMGGKPIGTTVDVRRHFKSLLFSVMSSKMIDLSARNEITLTDFFESSSILRLQEIHSRGLCNLYKNYFSALPGNLLGVHARFTQRDSPHSRQDGVELLIANARERHLLCLWIDRHGKVRCSSIGKTIFTAKSTTNQFDRPCCVHAEHLYSFFDMLLPSATFSRSATVFKTLKGLADTITLSKEKPGSFVGLNGTGVFVAFKDYSGFRVFGEQWVPIRVNTKRRGALTCAFCDNRSESNCRHISEWKRSQELMSTVSVGPGVQENFGSDIGFEIVVEEWMRLHSDDDDGQDQIGRSYLPISPINCPSSVRFDSDLAKYVKADTQASPSVTPSMFLVRAPLHCQKCGFGREEMTRKELDEGVLSCTTGPLKMKVETYRCCNLSCGSLIHEEGRSRHIVFYSFTSAATHVFMRREIQAVVLSGCTIGNRFSSYLRNRIEDRYSGVLSQAVVLRGSKTLSKLFSLTLKLIVLSPSPFFFSCNTCGVGKGNEASVVCVDGIWAGHDRASTKPLVSLSEECNPIPTGRATSHRAPIRTCSGPMLFLALYQQQSEEKNKIQSYKRTLELQ